MKVFVVCEYGLYKESGPTIIDTLNMFGPFDSDERANEWAKSEAKKRWESPAGLKARLHEDDELYAFRSENSIALPLISMYPDFPEERFLYEDCWFSVKKLSNPNGKEEA